MSKQKSIAIIDPVGIKAGMDYYDTYLAGGLQAAGFNCIIYSNFKSTGNVYEIFPQFTLSKFNQIRRLFFGILRALILAKKQKVKYLILHTFSTEPKDLYLFLCARFFGFKIINIAHDVSGFANKDSRKIQNLIYKKFSDYIIVHNQFSRKRIIETIDNLDEKKIHIVPHGHFLDLPDTDISKVIAREKLSIPQTENTVLFFGQIKKPKGLDVLIKSINLSQQNLVLTIAGKPWKDDFKTYEDLIDNLGLTDRVRKEIRYIKNEERELYFKAADVLVIPYKEIYQSGVLLMAMSYGAIVIASDLEPNKEVIQNGINGFLFKSENAEDLKEKIDEVINLSTMEKEKIRRAAKQTLESGYSWGLIGKRYKSFL